MDTKEKVLINIYNKKMKSKIITFIICLIFTSSPSLYAQSRDMLMNQGDKAYMAQEFLTAQSYYTESDLKKPSLEATYNQANSLFNQEKSDEASKLWERVTDSEDPNLKAAAYHNLGNVYLQEQKIDKAIESYKKALRIKPDDPGTTRNLAIAQLMKEQDPQEQEQEQSGENQEPQDSEDQEKSEQEQEEEGEEQDQEQEQEQEEQDPQDSEDEKENEDSGEKTEKEQLEEMTKQELERLLEVLEEEDKKVQQKAALGKTKGKKTDKEW